MTQEEYTVTTILKAMMVSQVLKAMKSVFPSSNEAEIERYKVVLWDLFKEDPLDE